ncbi:Noelin [Holothuria leucospilota]|uniref:Noelin n=1 Tax=Holothuria leucospilota TaxID=206669 RepID=A0A9Q1CHS5_HOLLE|nr:Noelin [Holothuria leucospilota]
MNFFVFVVGLVCLVPASSGFTTPVPGDSFNSAPGGAFSVHNTTMTSDGTCVCQINSPQTIQCTSVSNPETTVYIEQLHAEISQVSVLLNQHITVVESQGSQLTTLTSTMMTTLDKLERIESGNLVVSRPEYERLRREIADMEALLLILKQNQTTSSAVVVALETEIANITAVVNNLEENEEADTSRLLAEIEDLKQRLRDCQENQDNSGDLFETWNHPANQDTCRRIASVSSPYTVRGNSANRGTWFRDPVKDQGKVYVFSISNNRYYSYVDVYPTVTDFHNAGTPLRLSLPVNAQGTGMVAYNGSLFFHVYNNLNMGKYDIELQRLTKVLLPADTLYNNNGAYLSDTYSDIDFAADESGLWVIYSRSSSNGVMIISKVNPDTLALTNTWTTSVSKSTEPPVGYCVTEATDDHERLVIFVSMFSNLANALGVHKHIEVIISAAAMNVFIFVVGSASLIHSSSGFSTSFPDGSFNTTLGGTVSIHNATMTSDGTCMCQIKFPQTIQCTSVSNPETTVEQLQTAIANITEVMNSLEQNEGADTSRFVADIDGLKQRLLNCNENPNTGGDLSITWYHRADHDTCSKIESVSSPYTVRGNGATQGTWFRDPVKNQSKIYVFSLSNSRYHNYLNIYPTVTEFQNAGTSLRVNLPVYAQGTGMVAYNGSLFFHISNGNNYRYDSNSNMKIGKYDIELQQITQVPLPSDTRSGNNGAYLSDTYSDIDFAVDESGLWVIYSRTSSKGVMIVSKVDPETLAFTTTFVTSVPKTTVGNCFVMCKVFYCTNSFNTHADKSKINYYFDTKTSTEGFLYIPIDNKFRASYALNYNPYDQKLYGWDNGHQVVYQLYFEGNKE